MKGQFASILVVVALIVGAGIGYFGNGTKATTQTVMITFTTNNAMIETTVSTYTVTATIPEETNSTVIPAGESVMQCDVTVYSVISFISMENFTTTTSTSGGFTTLSYPIQMFNATTSLTETAGYATTTTYVNPSSTISGAKAVWTTSACTVISSG